MSTDILHVIFRRKLLPLLILSALPFLSAYGQSGYRNGTILVNDTTFLAGLILPVSNNGVVTSCLFREGSTSVPVRYTPADILAYYLNNSEKFLSGKAISPETAGLFLEVLFDGAADLYWYDDGNSDHYYISDIDERVFKLNVRRPGKRTSSETGQDDNEAVRSVLRVMMADATELSDRINTLVPDRESLVALMHDYHLHLTGTEADIFHESLPPALDLRAGLFAGYGADILSVEEGGDLDGFSLDPALYPQIGLTVSSPLPRITRNLSITLDISLAKRYTYGFASVDIPGSAGVLYGELHMHHLLLGGDLLAGYTTGKGRLRPSFFAGPAFQYILKEDSRTDYDAADDGLVVSESFPYTSDGTFRAGARVGAGLTFELNSGFSLFLNAGYARFSGDDAISGVNSVTVLTGIIF
ncbi:hypothetical protein EG827_09050 [bacterium]|nr:hypothetical protein [bacterium]